MRFTNTLRPLLIILPTIFAIACQSDEAPESLGLETAKPSVSAQVSASGRIVLPTPTPAVTLVPSEYPGVGLDEEFPIEYAEDSFGVGADYVGKRTIKIREFELIVVNSYPAELRGPDGRVLMRWKMRRDGIYRGIAAGFARLLGKNSEQLYIGNAGPGAICCSNYWIIDVGGPSPKEIFRSEDFGYFRDAMEVFDADGDGVLELAQFDSAFRYLGDDCGACTPEPRATFAFDRKIGRYLPAPGKRQTFAMEWISENQKYLDDNFARRDEIEIKTEYHRTALVHVVDLFYEGRTREAWNAFRKYVGGGADKANLRREISERLSESKYYRLIKNTAKGK